MCLLQRKQPVRPLQHGWLQAQPHHGASIRFLRPIGPPHTLWRYLSTRFRSISPQVANSSEKYAPVSITMTSPLHRLTISSKLGVWPVHGGNESISYIHASGSFRMSVPPIIRLTPRRSCSVLAHPQTFASSSSVAKPRHQSTPLSPYIVVSSRVTSLGRPGYGNGGCGFGIGLRNALAKSECPIALGFDGNGVSKARFGCRDPWEKARWCKGVS
jgi:hypothetical protein